VSTVKPDHKIAINLTDKSFFDYGRRRLWTTSPPEPGTITITMNSAVNHRCKTIGLICFALSRSLAMTWRMKSRERFGS